jgi:drug/metabolite transporter (DMT)-like permease
MNLPSVRAGGALIDRFNNAPDTLRGAIWMVIACACFSSMNGIIRHLGQDLPTLVLVFFRCLFGLLAMLPWLLKPGLSSLRASRRSLHVVRVVMAFVAMSAWFYGLTLMPLAEATALSFTMPLFASIAAVLFLGEVMRARRWTATLIGFAGAMIILRPGAVTISDATYYVLFATVLMAVSQTIVKLLSRSEHPNATVFWLVFLMTPVSFVPALFVWQTPTAGQFLWLIALGMVATLGHQCMARSLGSTDATAVYPLDFTRLIFAALIGYLAFSELPDFWTWVGAAVIMSSSIYIAHREAALRRAARLADSKADRGDGKQNDDG